MNISNEGGYVYPQGQSGNTDLRGITRRDWLAGLAMQGLLSNPNIKEEIMIAKTSYQVADAMIQESRS